MQPIIITTNYPDLYRLLGAILEKTFQDIEAEGVNFSSETDTIFIWSPEVESTLLDSYEKVVLVEQYARKLNRQIVLSAANDARLRQWGQKVGWIVFWQMPSLDLAVNYFAA
jgi:hypothetical protein